MTRLRSGNYPEDPLFGDAKADQEDGPALGWHDHFDALQLVVIWMVCRHHRYGGFRIPIARLRVVDLVSQVEPAPLLRLGSLPGGSG